MLILNPSQSLFTFTLLSGATIAISASSWFTIWLGLELNLMSFIPLMSSKNNQYSSEAALKYFLIQALGSAIILTSAPSLLMYPTNSILAISCALILKLGAAPFHFWLPAVMSGIPWPQCIILMTIQKLAPMLMLSYTLNNNDAMTILMLASLLSALVGALGGLNQTQLRKIMAYSSINHMAWMMAALMMSENSWITYFLFYSLISSSVAMLMYSSQIFSFKQLATNTPMTPQLKMTSFLSLLSLGGLPPFSGFIPKWMVMQELAQSKNWMILIVLLSSALITLFYYLRVATMSMSLLTPKVKLSYKTSFAPLMMTTSFVNLVPITFPILSFMLS